MPCSRTAALMRAIHRTRNWRLRCLRSRYPFAWAMTFLCLARAVTPRLTRGMAALLYAYGSIARTCCLSVACTSAVPRKWRLFLVVFVVRMWRLNACERLMLPPERILKRLAALRLVFILGIALLLFWHGDGWPQRSASDLGTTSSETCRCARAKPQVSVLSWVLSC